MKLFGRMGLKLTVLAEVSVTALWVFPQAIGILLPLLYQKKQKSFLKVKKLLIDAGVTILYGTYAVGVKLQDNKISHIITENKSGRMAYKVKAVVDATGDCDVAWFADAPTDTYQEGNKLASWYYYAGQNGFDLCQLMSADTQELVDKAKNGNLEPPPFLQEGRKNIYCRQGRRHRRPERGLGG